MEIKKSDSNTLIYLVGGLLTLLTVALGFWWLYLLAKLQTKILSLQQLVGINEQSSHFWKMVVYEGASFFIFVLIAHLLFLFFFIKDRKRHLREQRLFASLAHDLKTPLDTIRLQQECLMEKLDSSKTSDQITINSVETTLNSLNRLNLELETILLLSKIDVEDKKNFVSVDLIDLIERIKLSYPKVDFDTAKLKDILCSVVTSEYILSILIKNLIRDNSSNKKLSFLISGKTLTIVDNSVKEWRKRNNVEEIIRKLSLGMGAKFISNKDGEYIFEFKNI